MSEDFEVAEAPAETTPGPAARRRAERAAAANKPKSISGRLAQRFKRPDVRRRTAAILLVSGTAAVAWNYLGDRQPVDIAASLTNVSDAKVVAEPAPDAQMPALQTATAPTLPAPGGSTPGDADSLAVAEAPAQLEGEPSSEVFPGLTGLRETQASGGDVTCPVTVDAMSLAAATIALDIAAPCDAGKRVDVIQSDLQFAVMLNEEGTATLQMPALAAKPAIAVLITDREPVTLQTEAVDVEGYHRAVLHWQGNAGLELHAFEGQAAYGDEGHVGPEAPRTIAHALSGNGGFLTSLGDAMIDDARVAVVYTVPAGMAVDLSIEAPVTEANCDQAVYAGTIQAGPGIPAISQDVTLTMPSCDAVGDYVLLGSLMQPIAVATNQ